MRTWLVLLAGRRSTLAITGVLVEPGRGSFVQLRTNQSISWMDWMDWMDWMHLDMVVRADWMNWMADWTLQLRVLICPLF
jgi:hypothetical protein